MIGAVAGNKGAKFQSTPPVEGGDLAFVRIGMTAVRNFNPRHPWRVATIYTVSAGANGEPFQSTPPVEGGDPPAAVRAAGRDGFQSTPPVEGGDARSAARLAPSG